MAVVVEVVVLGLIVVVLEAAGVCHSGLVSEAVAIAVALGVLMMEVVVVVEAL